MEVYWSKRTRAVEPSLNNQILPHYLQYKQVRVCGAARGGKGLKQYCLQHEFSPVTHLPSAQLEGISKCLALIVISSIERRYLQAHFGPRALAATVAGRLLLSGLAFANRRCGVKAHLQAGCRYPERCVESTC